MPEQSFFSRIFRHRAVRYGLAGGAVVVLLFIALQITSKYLLKQWLQDNGADSVTMEKMRLNPFTGTLTLDGVDIKRADDTVYSNDIFQFNISMLSLFNKDIRIDRAVLQDMKIDIRRDENGGLRIGSYGFSFDEKQKTGKTIFPPWALQAEQVALTNVQVNYAHKDVMLHLVIDNGSIEGFNSSNDEKTGRIMLSGNLNDAPLEIEISEFVFIPSFSLSGDLTLTDFSLEKLHGFLEQQLSELGGRASTDGRFSFKTQQKKQMSANFDGSVKLADLSLKDAQWSAFTDLDWNGKITGQTRSAEKVHISMKGTLGAKNTEIVAGKPQLQWHHNKMALDCDGSLKSAGPLYFTGIAHLDMKEGKLLHPDEGKLAAFDSLVIQQLEHDDAGNLSIAAVDTDSLAVHESGFVPLALNAARVHLKDITTAKMENLEIDTVAAENMQLHSAGGQDLDFSAAVLELSDIVSTGLTDLAVGKLTLEDGLLPATEKRGFGVALDALLIKDMDSENLHDYTVDMLEISQARLNKGGNEKKRLAMEKITARQIAGQGTKKVSAEKIMGRQADFPGDTSEENALFQASLADMEASMVSWSKKNSTHVQSITGNDLQGRYTRKEENKEKTAKEKEAGKNEKPAPPVPLRIDKVTLTGSNRLEYTDPTRGETFSAVLTIDALDIADIDPGQAEQAFSYDLEGMVDKYSPLSISGSSAPLARPRRWEQNLHLQAYPVENLSAFTIELIGARVTGGKLELTSEFEMKGDVITMDNTLKVDEIKTKTVVPARLEKFNQKLPVSLDTALGLLQEDKTIQLSIPVEGKLSELDINYRDIMVTALSKAIGSAVQPLLAYSVLGPGGILVYMGMQIGKNLIKSELPELTFEHNSTVLTAAHKDSLDQVGHRLAQQIKQGEDISYYIYPRVAPREVSDAGDAALLDKKQRQELYALGEKRAHRVQSYLVNNFDIQEKNVPVFQPGIIYEKKESRGTVGFMK